jgi:hypothetical protein
MLNVYKKLTNNSFGAMMKLFVSWRGLPVIEDLEKRKRIVVFS